MTQNSIPSFTSLEDVSSYITGFVTLSKFNGKIATVHLMQNRCIHNENGPAVQYPNGDIEYWINGKQHRLDGPATERVDGTWTWFFRGLVHRIGGPAVRAADGSLQWFFANRLHRLDGPAIEWMNGTKEYWLLGSKVNFATWEESRKKIINKISSSYTD